MKRWNKAAAVLLVFVVLLLTCPTVHADLAGGADVSCTLTIHFRYEHGGVYGAEFYLYRVADVDIRQRFTTVRPFEGIRGDAFDFVEMTLTLRNRAQMSGFPPTHVLVTDDNGDARIQGLAPGVWLLISHPTQTGDTTHYVDPQVIIMPQKSEAGEYLYDITIHPKSALLPSYVDLTERTVAKVWDDRGYEKDRPESITVRLLKDGQVMDRVELSDANDWKHTWTDLIPTAKWSVEEDIPPGYTGEVQESEGVFTLTNHRKDVPQTGHIWWPVALVLAGGFVLVVLGVLLRRSGKHEA